MEYGIDDNKCLVKDISFEDIDDFIFNIYESIIRKSKDGDYCYVIITKNHKLIQSLIQVFIDDSDIGVGVIEYDGSGFDYNQEYIFTIAGDLIYIEPAIIKRDGKNIYLSSPNADLMYVENNCSSRVFIKNKSCNDNIVCFDICDCGY